jgi:hypothetical protein
LRLLQNVFVELEISSNPSPVILMFVIMEAGVWKDVGVLGVSALEVLKVLDVNKQPGLSGAKAGLGTHPWNSVKTPIYLLNL